MFKLELEKNGVKYSGSDLMPIYNEFKNIVNNYEASGTGKINTELANTGYKITLESKFTNFINDIKDSVDQLQIKFPNYNNYPTGPKNALLDMQYNLGENFTPIRQYNEDGTKKADGWPKLYRDVNNQDWKNAAKESNRPQVGKDRNNFVREQFLRGIKE